MRAAARRARAASRDTEPTADRGAGGVGIAARRSGSPRPAAWRCCGGDSAVAEEALAAARPSITVGGKRLWRNRNHLDAADMTEQQWRERWDALRMFFTADGESGKAGGNETIRVDEAGRLRIKVPAALADEFGTHLVIAAPVQFSHRADEWWARVAARQAVRYDITYDPDRGPLVSGRVLENQPRADARARRSARRPGAGRGPQCRSSGRMCA